MKVFISYHRADRRYRIKAENILRNVGVEYYAVPEDVNFNGWSAQEINRFICRELQECDVLLCLIGQETYRRPHVDREIHTALKGDPGVRLGIVGVLLSTRGDSLDSPNNATIPAKLRDNSNYVVWTEYNDLNSNIRDLIDEAYENSLDRRLQTNHSNPCMALRTALYYDN